MYWTPVKDILLFLSQILLGAQSHNQGSHCVGLSHLGHLLPTGGLFYII